MTPLLPHHFLLLFCINQHKPTEYRLLTCFSCFLCWFGCLGLKANQRQSRTPYAFAIKVLRSVVINSLWPALHKQRNNPEVQLVLIYLPFRWRDAAFFICSALKICDMNFILKLLQNEKKYQNHCQAVHNVRTAIFLVLRIKHVSVAGGESVFSAVDVSISGSAERGHPIHPSPGTAAGSIPSGADQNSTQMSDGFTWLINCFFLKNFCKKSFFLWDNKDLN